MYQRSVLIMIGLLALLGTSPVRLQVWGLQSGELQREPFSEWDSILQLPAYADLDEDGASEYLQLSKGRAALIEHNQAVWQSPPDWQVVQADFTDLDGNGQLEAALLVWRDYQPWPVDRFLPSGDRTAAHQDASGRSCQIILMGWKLGAYRELWAGSALVDPLLEFRAADLDGDGSQDLVVLESRYDDLPATPAWALSIWEWNGFGFSLQERVSGAYRHLHIGVSRQGERLVLTQAR